MDTQKINNVIKEIIDQAVGQGDELGAQVVIYKDGEKIVDCCSGYTSPDKTKEVDSETIFPVFSTGKAVASAAVHRLVEKGIMNYDMKVADYWPEFGCNGKENTTLTHVMSHRTGIFQLPEFKDAEEMADWELMCSRIAAATPAYTPGEKTSYQAATYSWLLGEFASRVDGRPFAQIVKEEICDPCGITSLHFGTDDKAEKHVATLIRGEDMEAVKPGEQPLDMLMNTEIVRRACLPAFNCMTNARSLAQFYGRLSGLIGDEKPLLSPETLKKATTLCRNPKDDIPITIGTWELFGLGFVLCGPKDNLGLIFGHGGYGGSEGLVVLGQNMIIAYTKNMIHGAQPTRDKIYEALEMKYRDWD